MKYRYFINGLMLAGCLCMMCGCSKMEFNYPEDGMMPWGPGGMGGMGGTVSDDGSIAFSMPDMSEWNGRLADDYDKDAVGTDSDIYHELSTFDNKVSVTYNGATAHVVNGDSRINVHVDGAYVTIDMKTNSVANVDIEVKGSSDDGGLKIYGEKKFKLSLNGVDLKSKRGAAINNQCKKRMFVVMESGSVNRLEDESGDTVDSFYLDESESEDCKGCMFSESSILISGDGALVVSGKNKHAIATDKSFVVRPGATVVVPEAAKNGIHVKGDSSDEAGIRILGGLVYVNVGSEAGKCMKSDMDVAISGGSVMLNTTGNAIFDAEDNDTSSAAGLKTDGAVIISGGTHYFKSSGDGGKGINADGDIEITDGEIYVTTSGGKYVYSSDMDASPKGIKADGNVNISGGKINIAATGKNDGSEGLESKAVMNLSGGEIYVYAYDDAINATSGINISGGRIFAYSENNDGIDSNGTLTVTDGVVTAYGASAPESGIDVDNTNWFKIDGGYVFAVGGTLMASPSSASGQPCAAYSGFSASKGALITVCDSQSSGMLTMTLPRTVNGGNLLVSSPGMSVGSDYSISKDCEITGYDSVWNGWYDGGHTDGGTVLVSFTQSSVITMVGTGSMGGFPGMGGPGMGNRR